jgi:hypothetical protein
VLHIPRERRLLIGDPRHLGGNQLPAAVSSYCDAQMSEPASPGIALNLLGVSNDGGVPMNLDIDPF